MLGSANNGAKNVVGPPISTSPSIKGTTLVKLATPSICSTGMPSNIAFCVRAAPPSDILSACIAPTDALLFSSLTAGLSSDISIILLSITV